MDENKKKFIQFSDRMFIPPKFCDDYNPGAPCKRGHTHDSNGNERHFCGSDNNPCLLSIKED